MDILVILSVSIAITSLLSWFDSKVETDIFRPRLANNVAFLLLCYSLMVVPATDSILGTLLKYVLAAPYFVVDYFLTPFEEGRSISVSVVMVAVTIYYLYILACIAVWLGNNIRRNKRTGPVDN